MPNAKAEVGMRDHNAHTREMMELRVRLRDKKNPATVALGKIKSKKKAAASRRNGKLDKFWRLRRAERN